MTDLIYASKNDSLVSTLQRRRSTPVKLMGGQTPTDAEINTMLEAAMRVPDHGKLFPWWFVVFTHEKRAEFGEVIKQAWKKREPDSTPEKLADEANRFMRAPLVIAVISSPRESLIPVWEQVLSAGAACYNLSLAANALGYGANWLTEWYAYDPHIRESLTLGAHENIAGFVYIGTPTAAPEERTRPDPALLVNTDFADIKNKGDGYAKQGLGHVYKGPERY